MTDINLKSNASAILRRWYRQTGNNGFELSVPKLNQIGEYKYIMYYFIVIVDNLVTEEAIIFMLEKLSNHKYIKSIDINCNSVF